MMEMWKRIASTLLALMLLVTGMQLPTVRFAAAEETAGSTTVSAAPETLLSMGEWQYYVEDGQAIVAGYANTEEAALTVPYQLGGYPVTGIGHQAFAANTGLKTIQLHTNVTAIASDAFEGLQGVTVAAYHGAYALDYAAAHGMEAKNLSTVAEFADNAIDLTGLSAKAYSGLTDDAVTFRAREATFLKEGQAVYFPAQNGYPTGLASLIVAIIPEGDLLRVIMERPEMGVIFESLHVQDEVTLDWENAVFAEGVTVEEMTGEAVSFSASPAIKLSFPIGGQQFEGSLSLTEKLTVDVDIGLDGFVPKLKKASVQESRTTKVEGSFSSDVTLMKKRPFPREKKEMGVAEIPIVGAGAITGYVALDFIVTMSGELSFSYSSVSVQKWEYKNGKISETKSDSATTECAVSATLKVGPSLKVYLVIGFAKLSIRFFEVSAGVFLVASGEMKITGVTGTEVGHICMEVSNKLVVEASVKFGIIKVFSEDLGLYVSFTKKWELAGRKTHFDYPVAASSGEILFTTLVGLLLRVDKCLLEGRKVVYDPDNGSDEIEQEYDVNQLLKAPTAPKKDGYRFDGWYVDTAKSGLSGKDYKVNFGVTKMPYVGRDGTLYLYARWHDIRPVTSIKLDRTQITGLSNVGHTERIETQIYPANANNKNVKWYSSDTNVARVDQKGKVTLRNAGTAVITCQSVGNPSVKSTCTVTVQQSVTGIALNTNNIFRYSDNMSSVQLTASAQPANAANKAVTWTSSNPAVATVSANGYVTLKGLGTATITCRSVSNENVVATCSVAVRQAVTSVSLDKTSHLRTNADMSSLQLKAAVSPANAYNKAIKWTSSNPAVATVTSAGKVNMVGVGKATITAASVSNPGVSDSFELEIIQAVTEIALNESAVTCYSDHAEAIQLTADALPTDAGNKAVTWETSNSAVATVSQSGAVTIVGAGQAVITCRSVSNPDVTGNCRFTVLQAVTGITLNKTEINTSSDEINVTYLLEEVAPADAASKAVVWQSSDPAVATVTGDGVVTITGVGEAVITCQSVITPGVTAECAVKVVQAVSDMYLNQISIFCYSGEKENVQLIATLAAAGQANKEVRWESSNTGVATVSDAGIVTVTGVGEAIITCTSVSNPDVTAQCAVTVKQSVEQITLNETDVECFSDDAAPVQLAAEASPADAANPALRWESSDTAVAVVSDAGLVTIAGPGSAVITCRSVSDPEISASCTVTVHQAVSSIYLNMTEVTRYTNETGLLQLAAYVRPSYAYDSAVTWESSNEAVAVVSETGAVEIRGAGEATITCTSVSSPAASAQCSITVRQAVDSVGLSETDIEIFSNDEAVQLTAEVLPASAEDPALEWVSSDTGVATVSDEGLVTVVGCGTAAITCRALSNPEAYAVCNVTVKQAVLSLGLSETDVVCYSDETDEVQLTASVQPVYAEDKAVQWTSSNEAVAAVSDSGVLTVVGVGEAVITCRSISNPDAAAECTVTVLQAMTDVALDCAALTLYSDDTEGAQLNCTISPADAAETEVIWQSDNAYAAVVSDAGLVTAVGQGTATITCHSVRNPETVFAACTVTVKQGVEEVQVEGDTASLLPGETLTLRASCYPEYADDTSVVWRTDDASVAEVDENGCVTAKGYGTAVITATARDGRGAAASYTVNVEHELVLNAIVESSKVYLQGTEGITLASVRIGSASVRRMAEKGEEPIWTLVKPDENDNVQLDVITTTVTDRGQSFDTTYVLLMGSEFSAAGSRTYTIQCEAGGNTETAEVTVQVDGTAWAETVTLPSSTIMLNMDESCTPELPVSGDENAVPADLRLESVHGDAYFADHAALSMTNDGWTVSFDESGVYTAVVRYRAANIAYETNVSFFVQDEDGIVRFRTESITLDESFLTLVQGESHALTATVSPLDAYDASVAWSSTDESVVKVDQDGLVTAVAPGKAAIVCTANDGFGASAMCAVNVEGFLQLDDSLLEYTVYTGGSSHANLGIVNVTIESEKRLHEAGLNVTWTLEKVSVTASEAAVEEFRAVAEESITVSGNRIKLLRMNAAGSDEYRLVCRAGVYTDSCTLRIHVVDEALPETIALPQTEYACTVEEYVRIDTAYTGGTLPGDATLSVSGGSAFENALSFSYDFTEPENLIFSVPGTYAANVIFSGSNYAYACPVTIVVSDAEGNVPQNITGVSASPENLYMVVGEQSALSAAVEPADVPFSKMTWSSSDTSVATVSASGVVTAMGAGNAYVTVSVPESDFVGGCLVIVEDGLTLQTESVERTVFVDGITRTRLETVQLTTGASSRLDMAPEWTLTRVSGNNLTLRVKEYNTADSDGGTVYGCAIILYSMSREGTAEYELTCTAGDETVTVPVTVRAVSRDRNLPAGLTFAQTVYTAGVNELITIVPEISCLPEGTILPDGMRVALEGDALFASAQNTADYCVSQNMTTLSFNRAGLFEANFIYTYSNMRYAVPVTFRIADENGSVPVLASSVTLSSRSLWLTEGEEAALSAVFTPANADNQSVAWQSSDETIVTVDENGLVTAVGQGEAFIICTPSDPLLTRQVCTVWVEEYLTLETAENQISLYRQGTQKNEIFSALLSEGTIQRLAKADAAPEWTLERVSGDHSEAEVSASGDGCIVTSTALLSGGSDVYRLTCRAGEYVWSADFTLEVIDLGDTAESITLAETSVSADVGQMLTLDFTPVCSPDGSSMPENDDMWSLYTGVGEGFYEAMDYGVYAEDGDKVTVCFTRAGRYLLARQFFLNNLHYEQVCEINVGQSAAGYSILKADATDTIVYLGGKAGNVAEISLTDSIMHDIYGDRMQWSLSRTSGSSLTAALKETANGVTLYAVDAAAEGEDVWRVTCTFGDFSESIDVKVSVRKPRSAVPESLTLVSDRISGMMGDWLSLPIAAQCLPVGSALPETGDDFWTFEPTGMAADVCSWDIEDGLLRVLFLWPGYYTGLLRYEAGSFRYEMPVYLAITDEEGVLSAPAMEMYLLDTASTVYVGGSTGIAIGTAQVSHGLGDYYAGEAAAYMMKHEATWSVSVTSGTAATLSIRESGSTAAVMLDSVVQPGSVTYEVSCTVNGKTYAATGALTVLDASAALPDPTLSRSVYYARPGEVLTIPTTLYQRGSSTILQGAAQWNPDAFLPAIGHTYTQTADELQVTFYTEGTYATSVSAKIGNHVCEIPFTIVVSRSPEAQYAVMKLPAALQVIEAYAFAGSKAQVVDLRGTRVTRIEAGAFSGCIDLVTIYIPSSVTEIASGAFSGCLNVAIVCEKGSAADTYAAEQGISVRYE